MQLVLKQEMGLLSLGRCWKVLALCSAVLPQHQIVYADVKARKGIPLIQAGSVFLRLDNR